MVTLSKHGHRQQTRKQDQILKIGQNDNFSEVLISNKTFLILLDSQQSETTVYAVNLLFHVLESASNQLQLGH